MYPEFPYVAFIASALVLVPLPWHWRAGNVATLSMIAWLFVVDIIYGVDAIVWSSNVHEVIPVWCDITTKVLIGANIALPAACLCVCMHLERVASVRQVRTTHADKRRRQIIEACFCFGLPALWMALHYIVQGHRFDIIEGFGCRPATYVSLPAIFLIWVPPLILSAATCVFATLALHHFIKRRITFASHLEARSGLTTARYLQLMLLAVAEMILSVGSTALALWSATFVMRPWTNWTDVHWGFSRVDTFRAFELSPSSLTSFYALWWMLPISSFLFFLFFAFGQDAVQEYGACLKWIRIHIFRFRIRETSRRGFKLFSPSNRSKKAHLSLGTMPSFYTPSTPSSPGAEDPAKSFQDDNRYVVSFPSASDLPAYETSTPTSSIFLHISADSKDPTI